MMKRHTMPLRTVMALIMLSVMLVQNALAAAVSCTVSSNTKVYESASTSAKSVKVGKNQKVTLTSIENNWAYITNPTNGVKAYIPVKYLTLGGSLTVYTTKATFLYKSASTSTKLTALAKNTQLTVSKRSSSYLYGKDSVSGKYGYVKIDEITTTKPATVASATETVKKQPETTEDSTTLVPVSGVSCTVSSSSSIYKTESTSTKLASVSKKKTVTLLSTNGKWAKVYDPASKVTGYMYLKSLKLGSNVTMYATGNTYLYKKASSSKKLVSLAKGTKLTITKVYNSSYLYGKDNTSGKSGYVKIGDTTTTKLAMVSPAASEPETQNTDSSTVPAPASGINCTVTSSAKIYKTESTSTKLASISKKKAITLISVNGPWAKVYDPNSKVTGYMYMKYLKLGSNLTMYATASSYLYKKASTSKKLVALAKGTKLTITKVYNSTYLYGKDSVSGKSGYVKIDLLTTTKVVADPVKAETETQPAVSGLKCTTSSSVTLYKTEGATKLASIAKGKSVTLISTNAKWAKVYDPASKQTGYIYVKYLTLGGNLTVYCVDDTHLYTSISASKKACDLVKGSKVTVTKVASSTFYYGKDPVSGKSGYLKITHATTAKVQTALEELGITADTTTSNSKIQTVIKVANSFLGVPYSYSANPPKSFDCSTFTRYLYKQVGITLPGTAYTQGYSSAYTKISTISALKVGDVVCFNTNSSDGDLSDHVGIYLGNGQFIHASSAGGKVIISTLASGYYKGVFSWARRIIN